MKIIKPIKDNIAAIAIIIAVAIGIVFVFGSGLFSIIAGGEKSYEVGDMISGSLGLVGSAAGPNDGNGLYSIEIKQIDGTWRTAWSQDYANDLKITFTRVYPNIYKDIWKDYGDNVACDSPGEWGYRTRDGVLTGFVEPGCYSYIPRLRDAYSYNYRYAEGIMLDFTANDVQEDGKIIYKNVVTSSSSGASFDVTVSDSWNLVPNPNPKECSNLEYDVDIVNKKYRQCDADGYWTAYTVCDDNENLVVNKGVYSCELIPEPVIVPDETITNPPTGAASSSFDIKSYYDFTNNPVKAGLTTGAIVVLLALLIIFLPGKKGGKRR